MVMEKGRAENRAFAGRLLMMDTFWWLEKGHSYGKMGYRDRTNIRRRAFKELGTVSLQP